MPRMLALFTALSLLTGSTPSPACTVLVASDGTSTLVGNNEDHFNPATLVWFIPRDAGRYGRMYFGFDDHVRQGGMNEKGLFFDTVSAPRLDMPEVKGKALFKGDLIAKAMEECATVADVIALFKRVGPYSDPTEIPSIQGAILFADRDGHSVIIEGVTFVESAGHFQVMTNYYQSHPELGGYPCRRYEIATKLLQEAPSISQDLIRKVLAATHQEHEPGFSNPTVYSNIYDLKRGLVSVYLFHNFENGVIFNLEQELAKGPHEVELPTLFEPTMASFVYENVRPRALADVLRQVIHEQGISAVREVFIRLRGEVRQVPRYFVDPKQLNALGYELLAREKLPEAIEVFKLYAESFPEDWNAHDSLGEAYARSGMTDLAIHSYEESLRLNPGNTNGLAWLERLRSGP